MNFQQRNRRRNKGFTLLEVLLVMAILIILMSLAGAAYFTYFANSQEDAARLQMNTIEKACAAYQMRVGRPPGTINDLVQPPSGMSQQKWKGPYIENGKLPMDPWDQPYELSVGQTTNGRPQFIIKSPGPPGQNKPITNQDEDPTT